MANHTVSANQLNAGAIVLIRGKVSYARLAKLIDGEDLQRSDARRVQSGMSPVERPHTTVTLTEAEVLYKDPANPTLEEVFVAERRYASKTNPTSGANYSIDNKSTQLPVIAIPDGQGRIVQDDSGRELATGVDVTLVLRVYKPKSYSNHGLSLDQVIVNEEPRYYVPTGGVDMDELAQRGFVYAAQPTPVQAGTQDGQDGAGQPSAGQQSVPANSIVNADGLAFPAPQGETAPAVAQPAVPAAAAAPAAPAAVAQDPWTGQPVGQAAPAAPVVEETIEAKLARLEAENNALKDAGSAVGAPAPAGIVYQG